MKKFGIKFYFAVFAIAFVMLFTCGIVCGNSFIGDFSGTAVVVYAAEESVSDSAESSVGDNDADKNEAVTDGSNAEIPTIGAVEDSENKDSSSESTTDANAQAEAQKKEQQESQSTFFKWAIPITCVLSLVLAVFLAIRKANKKFGKEWE